MPDHRSQSPLFTSLISKEILRRAFLIATMLGSILTLANQSGAIFGSDEIQVLPLVLVYLTPFVVITVSQVLGLRRALLDARSPRYFSRRDTAFLVTAMSHSIPRRAFFVALVIGIANTFIVASSALILSGSISNISTALVAQTFALPMLFGLLSQTLAYRRAMSAICERLQAEPQALSI
jgi:hypothetical protein